MNLATVLIVILLLMCIGAFPTWPHSAEWGYYPSGGLGFLLLVIVILYIARRI